MVTKCWVLKSKTIIPTHQSADRWRCTAYPPQQVKRICDPAINPIIKGPSRALRAIRDTGLGKRTPARLCIPPLRRVSQCNAVFKRGAAKSQRLIKGHLDGKMKTWQPERLTSSHIKELPKQRGSTHGSARKISASFTATQGERPPSFFLSDCLSMGWVSVFFVMPSFETIEKLSRSSTTIWSVYQYCC